MDRLPWYYIERKWVMGIEEGKKGRSLHTYIADFFITVETRFLGISITTPLPQLPNPPLHIPAGKHRIPQRPRAQTKVNDILIMHILHHVLEYMFDSQDALKQDILHCIIESRGILYGLQTL